MSARTIACVTVAALLAGCGSGSAPQRPSERLLVAALGDSITAGSPRWDPAQAVRDQIGGDLDPESEFEYWAQLALAGRASFRNCGVFGERTDQVALRLGDCARGASVLVVQGGINDIAQGRPPAAAGRSLEAMVARGRALRMRVLLCEVLPWNNGYPRAAPAIRRLNALIVAIARRERVTVVPFYGALLDPRRPGRMRAALTADGDHPSVAGYRILGRELAARLRAG